MYMMKAMKPNETANTIALAQMSGDATQKELKAVLSYLDPLRTML